MGGKGIRNREQKDAYNARRRAKRAALRAERLKKEEEEEKQEELRKFNWRRSLEQEVQDLGVRCTPLFTVDEEKLDIKTVALRFLLSGRGFSDFAVFQNFENEKLGKAEFLQLAELVYAKVDEVADKKLKERRERLEGESIFMEIDCRWATRGFDAKEATVSGFDEGGDLLTVVNLFREGKFKNCSLEAKGMEGFGVKLTCEQLKEEGIELETMLHDADSSSYYNARSIFPNLKELYCNNHTAKNIR